jgi:methionyl-tRNA formyltransferase
LSLRVVFMGSPDFAVPVLHALHKDFNLVGVVTQQEKPKGRGRRVSPTPVKEAAMKLGVEIAEPENLRSDEFMSLLGQWRPEVIVVAAFGKILPKKILDFPRLGCVNLHASLLPDFRGASPISSAILSGAKETGVCTILMDEGMDTGPILLERKIPIHDDDTTGSLHDRMLEPGAELVVETLSLLADGKIAPKPQEHSKASYTQLLKRDDGRFDWSKDADYLDRLARAMNPWPVAFFVNAGEQIKVWRARPAEGAFDKGCIKAIDKAGISVGTGAGLIILEEVQPPGKKRMSGRDFSVGRRLSVGHCFD